MQSSKEESANNIGDFSDALPALDTYWKVPHPYQQTTSVNGHDLHVPAVSTWVATAWLFCLSRARLRCSTC